MYTKRYFVTKAFEELGYAEYVFDLSPEQLNGALQKLDGQMAAWDSKGVRVGWPIPGSAGGSSLDQETPTPDAALEAVYLNLAIRLGPSIGKEVSADTKNNAKQAYEQLMSLCAMPGVMVFPNTMPSGAGNKPWRTYDDPFLQPPREPLLSGPDGRIEFN